MDVILRSIEQKWDSSDLKVALVSVKKIKKKRLFDRVALGEFYALVGAVTVGVEQAIEDRKWEISQ